MKRILLISDVDGCLTDGGMYYDSTGKVMKRFSAGDHEGLKLLKINGVDVIFITADKAGGEITKQRIKDMSDSKLFFISESQRPDFFIKFNSYDFIGFFGDGLGDAKIKKEDLCDWFCCPKQSLHDVKKYADEVTNQEGGHAAFLDMAILLLDHLKTYNFIDNIKDLY